MKSSDNQKSKNSDLSEKVRSMEIERKHLEN